VKAGDLVKIKWITGAQKRRAQKTGFPPVETPGLVINKLDLGEYAGGFVAVVEVMFPERPGRFVSFAETDLEVIDGGR
jgi:hypothetical protein